MDIDIVENIKDKFRLTVSFTINYIFPEAID